MPSINYYIEQRIRAKKNAQEERIWRAIEAKDAELVRFLLFGETFGEIDLETVTSYGDSIRNKLLNSEFFWHGRLLKSGRRHDRRKISFLFYEKLAKSGLIGNDLLLEALLRRGFLAYQDEEGVWLGTGSHADDLIVLSWVVGVSVTPVQNHKDRMARVCFSCGPNYQLRCVEGILSIPQNMTFMSELAYDVTYQGYNWLSYRNTVWGTKLSVCPSTYLRGRYLGYDALDAGIALMVKAWPLARVSTGFGSCDGHGISSSFVPFKREWDRVWAQAVFSAIDMPTPGSRWFRDGRHSIETIDNRDDDDSILAMMEDIQNFARCLLERGTIEKIGIAHRATLAKFGESEPRIGYFAQEAAVQLSKMNLKC